MEVILKSEVDKLGIQGQVVKVAAGFARNYLLPQGLAVPATPSNKKIVEQQRQSSLRKDAKLASDAGDLAKLLAPVAITIKQKAGEEGQLFGSVTSQDLHDALDKQGFKIDRKKIVLEHPIKMVGDYKVTVKLHKDVSVDIPVHVLKEETE
jgi:large subunit ribosomal protein L9